MARGHSLGLALHDLEVHQDFAGALLGAAKLVALEVHQAHVLRLHEAFAYERGCADGDVLSGADGDVAAVAVHVGSLPEAATDFTKLFLQCVGSG